MKYVMKTKLKEKGQLTIPSKIRKLAGLKVGEELLIFALKDEIIIRSKIKNPVEKAGILGRENIKSVRDLLLRYGYG